MTFDLVATVSEIVAREVASTDPERLSTRIYNALKQVEGVEAPPGITLHYREYEVLIAGGPAVEMEVAQAAWCRSLNIAAAPEIAAVIAIPNASVLVRRYWACPDERILHVHGSDLRFQAAARDQFRRDMQTLADHERVHTYVRSFAHWYVAERTGTIVLSDWHALQPEPDPEERAYILSLIDRQLEQRAA